MGAASWAIPVGILAGICIIGFFAVWYWFPRMWQKGVNSDHRDIEAAGWGADEQERAAHRAQNWANAKQTIERAKAAELAKKHGRVVEVDRPQVDENGMPLKPPGYTPM